MIDQHIKTVREALEHLHGLCSEEPDFVDQITVWVPEALTALAAIEQAMREPVFWYDEEDALLFKPCEVRPGEAYPLFAAPPAQQAGYTAGDMASAAAQGFRDGQAAQQAQPTEWYEALEFVARHLSSDWPEECQQMVRKARKALRDCPAQQEQDK